MAQKKKFSVGINWWVGVLGALVVSVGLNLFLLLRGGQESANGVRVEGVIDGDTIVLEGKSRIRLRYVDAPEMEYCGGQEAKEELERLVAGKKVRIEEQIADQYGRGMALVYAGSRMINKEMLDSGWVRYHHDNSEITEELKKAAAGAREKNLGIYGNCQSKDIPDKTGCVIKGNIDDSGKNRIYYLPGCSQYRFTVVEKDIGENWFCTEKEAVKAGFVRAKTC